MLERGEQALAAAAEVHLKQSQCWLTKRVNGTNDTESLFVWWGA